FSNDTLVIRAEKKIFRVSKSVLAARSSVFRDTVAFPQSMGGDPAPLQGSPVVTLHDAAPDVEAFLQATLDSRQVSAYFMPPPTAVELDVVLWVLRLAHKYDVHYIYLRALQHLSVC
ncbi:hypothetical protein DFH09DRAFT_918388, partial [Mycena vulgaris]